MALIQQKKTVKPKMVKKEVTLEQKVWSEMEQYIRYAGISGTPQEKREFLIKEALFHVFNTDEGFKKIKSATAKAQNAEQKQNEKVFNDLKKAN